MSGDLLTNDHYKPTSDKMPCVSGRSTESNQSIRVKNILACFNNIAIAMVYLFPDGFIWIETQMAASRHYRRYSEWS